MRTCIGCRQQQPKRELLRVVRTPAGTIELDSQGKRSGRGAYICANRTCLQAAFEQRRLEKALKCRVSDRDVMILKEAVGSLLDRDEVVAPDVSLPNGETIQGQAK